MYSKIVYVIYKTEENPCAVREIRVNSDFAKLFTEPLLLGIDK